MQKENQNFIRNNKIVKIKKIILLIISVFLIFDCFFLAFITEPFIFDEGVNGDYVVGVIMFVSFYTHLVWINSKDIKKIEYLSYKNLVVNFGNNKNSYYFHLKMGRFLVTVFVSFLIVFGAFVIIVQHELLIKNLHIFFRI